MEVVQSFVIGGILASLGPENVNCSRELIFENLAELE